MKQGIKRALCLICVIALLLGAQGVAEAVEWTTQATGAVFGILLKNSKKDEKEGVIWANGQIYLSGHLPGNGVVEAEPVTATIEGEEVLSAWDVRVYANENQRQKGKTWQPAGKKVTVHFYNEAFNRAEDLKVYHITDEGAVPVEVLNQENGWLKFEADHFSVYAVTGVIEKDIEIGGDTYRVTLSYDASAGIPEGAELEVSPLEVTGEEAAAMMGYGEDDLVFYSKLLDIAIMHEGVEIEPAEGSNVTVSVKLLDAEPGAEIDVFHMLQTRGSGYTPVPVESRTEGDTVTFTTDSFSLFGFSSTAKEILNWTDELLKGAILGKTSEEKADYALSTVSGITKGLELLEAYTVTRSENLWLSLQRVKELALGRLESVDLYTVANGRLGELIQEGVTLTDVLRYSLSDMGGFALVRDTGLRERVLNALGVTVDGMVPKAAELTVKQVQTALTLDDNSEALASYDITINNADEAWQPGEAVQVSLACPEAAEALADGYGVELWHVADDGSAAKVDYTLEGDSLRFEAESFSEYTVVKTVLEKTIFVEGDTYKITVVYDSESGLPEGVDLAVEVKDPADYRQAAAEALNDESVNVLRAFDISIVDAQGVHWNPTKDVSVTIELMGEEGLTDPTVVHIPDDADAASEAIVPEVDGSTLSFATDSFSVYVIVEHEGGAVVTPRFTIHFISPITDTNTQEEVIDDRYYYTAAPYEFLNRNMEKQTTQILRDGETLELIANPPNLASGFFYGWYVVDMSADNDSSITFQWTDSPKELSFNEPVAVADNGDGTFTMTWTAPNGETCVETAPALLDDGTGTKDYSAHIYVAPLYEKYYFVNFHELAYAVSSQSNLLTRKLTILGSDNVESVLVSDVVAESTDIIRRIFRGWQYRVNDTWISVQTIDDNGNTIAKRIDVTGDTNLYPYYQEGRWLYFNVGESGNGASYVPAQFTMSEFDAEGGTASVGGKLTSLPTSERVGYDFGGWRVVVATDETDPDNPVYTYALITDGEGKVLSNFTFLDMNGNEVDPPQGQSRTRISMNEAYKDNDGNDLTGVAYTVENGVLSIKFPLSSLTLYARWTEKTDTHYTVVIWKQKVTDDKDASKTRADYAVDLRAYLGENPNGTEADFKAAHGSEYRTYDYYALNVSSLPTTVDSTSGLELSQLNLLAYQALTTNPNTQSDFVGFHHGATDMSDTVVRGDGSTVVNVYYDRDLNHVYFYANTGYTQINSNFDTENVQYYGRSGNYNNYSYFAIQRSGNYWYNGGNWYNTSNGIYYKNWTPIEELTITALYGQDIHLLWPSMVDSSQWPSNWHVSRLETTMQSSISSMPAQDSSFYIMEESGSYEMTTKYWIQQGNTNEFELYSSNTFKGNSTGYYTTIEEYTAIDGFKVNIDPDGGSNDQENNSIPEDQRVYNPAFNVSDDMGTSYGDKDDLTINIYYLRNAYTLIFDYNYPSVTGMAHKESRKEGVLYESLLSAYKDEWPAEADVPDHYEFKGWYEDASGTVRFDFDNTTMPAADKIIYGKWEPIYYTVSIDPNGGVINHINFDEPTDGAYATFYLTGFKADHSGESETIQKAWTAALEAVGNDTSWVNTLASIGTGHVTSQSTYFNAQYGTPIGQYELERAYVEYEGADDGTRLYYLNMQYDDDSGDWGLHADMRNALYLTRAQLEAYYQYCLAAKAWHDEARPGYYDGVIPNTFEGFMDRYVKKNAAGTGYALYTSVASSSYAFVGWYVVKPDGSLSDTPYSFTNAIENDLVLRAVWRKIGAYYIAYDPVYQLEVNGSIVVINGDITEWTDPANANDEKYADGAPTTTLQQPTGIHGSDGGGESDYIFRGWRIVRFKGYDANNLAIYEQYPGTGYYEQTIPFTINADYADPSGCIHMQAVYQPTSSSDRRPNVANLTLKANTGFMTDRSGSAISADADITSETGWGVGKAFEDHSEQALIFGDMQSNDAIHLMNYAVSSGMLPGYESANANYFGHNLKYLLIGFDKGSDFSMENGSAEDDLLTGKPYIPTYAADAVISVQRTDRETLYAVWEPMVYLTITNRSSQPVEFSLTSTSGDAFGVVNEVTGVFSREARDGSAIGAITLEAGESVKFVLPKGKGKNFTISGTNTNTAQLLNITSYQEEELPANQTGRTTAGLYRSSGAGYDLTDTLIESAKGMLVFFDGVDTVFFDTKDGEWTDTRTGNSYQAVVDNASLIYVDEDGLPYQPLTLPNKATEPAIPTRSGYTFVGWTTSREAAECDLAGYTLPGTSEADHINNLAVIRNGMLWDFNTTISEGMTLYAVWGETVTVRFHYINNTHTFNPGSADFVGPTNGSGNDRYYTVSLAKGDTVRQPENPSWRNDNSNLFYRWVKGVNNFQSSTTTASSITPIYDFSAPVLSETHLYTSWVEASSFVVRVSKNVVNGTEADADKEFTFSATITTTTYTRTNINNSTGNNVAANRVIQPEDPIVFKLKAGETRDFVLYFNNYDSEYRPNNSTLSIFFQSIVVTEEADANFTTTVSVNGNSGIRAYTEAINSISNAPDRINVSRSGNSGSRTFTLNGRNYTDNTVTGRNTSSNPNTIAFTNTRTNTDVTVTKAVTQDEYLTGSETFEFTATYKDGSGAEVVPAVSDGYTVSGNTASFTLTDGGSVTLRGVPIGGSVTVTESAAGWTAASEAGVSGETATVTGEKTITYTNVPAENGAIAFTNTRERYSVKVTNAVPGYGSKDKGFAYTATLWNGDAQAAFPEVLASVSDVSFTNERKNMAFSLKHGDNLLINDLPGGYRLVVTQTAETDYVTESTGEKTQDGSAITDGDTESGSVFIIADIDADAQIDFVNTLKTGSYVVTKNVQLSAGDTLESGKTFAFTAKLLRTAASTTPVALSTELQAMAEAAGANVNADQNAIQFSLADGGSMTLSGLPVGYFLQVQESAPGFAAYVSGIRTDSVTAQINETDNSDINYINRRASVILNAVKVEKDDPTVPVPGAEFRLYKLQGSEQQALFILTSDENGLLKYTEAGVSSADMSLENGTYYLAETSAPEGFQPLAGLITITVDNAEPELQNWLTIDESDFASLEWSEEDGRFKLTIRNDKTKTVTVRKALSDPMLAEDQSTFTFNATLSKADGTPIQDHALAEGITTGEDGRATFTLTPVNDGTAAERALTVPYGAQLVIAEATDVVVDDPGTVGDIYETTYVIDEDEPAAGSSHTFKNIVDDHAITFTNTRKTVKLIVDKTVTGAMGDMTKPFAFEVSGFQAGKEVPYAMYETSDGVSYEAMSGDGASGMYTATEGGVIGFELRHRQRIELSVLVGTTLTLTENAYTGYTTTMDDADGRTKELTLNTDMTVEVVNDLSAVSPTGLRLRIAPYALMLLVGVAMLLIARRRRE